MRQPVQGKVPYASPVHWMTIGLASRFGEEVIALVLALVETGRRRYRFPRRDSFLTNGAGEAARTRSPAANFLRKGFSDG
jgi:hypothetical protein